MSESPFEEAVLYHFSLYYYSPIHLGHISLIETGREKKKKGNERKSFLIITLEDEDRTGAGFCTALQQCRGLRVSRNPILISSTVAASEDDFSLATGFISVCWCTLCTDSAGFFFLLTLHQFL
jgi:hypothetical protein